MLRELPLVAAGQAPFNHGIERRGLPVWEYHAVKCRQHSAIGVAALLHIDFMLFDERIIQG
jgi:hypothetical protein